MVDNKTKALWTLLSLLLPFFLQGQEKIETKRPLTEILESLQAKHHCQFAYADKVVNNIYVSDVPPNISLKKAIGFLEKKTHLIFRFIDNRHITISPRNKSFFVCGYLMDKETKQPISSASLNDGNSYTITDEKGFFKLKVFHDKDTIIIRHIAYNPIYKLATEFDKNHCKKIFLTERIETLSTIILNNLISKGIYKMKGGVTKIDVKRFGILPGLIEADILQTIQALPGIQSINETVSNINIRGGTNDQNLLLWDGVRLYQSGHFFGLISTVNPLSIKEVLLFKNGTSAEYDHAVSGTIAMQSDSLINKNIKGSLGMNFIHTDAFADIPLGKKSSLQIGLRKAISKWIETPTYTQYYNKVLQNTEVTNNPSETLHKDIHFDFYDINLRLNYKLSPKDYIRFNFIKVSDQFDFKKKALIAHQEASKEGSLVQSNMAEGLLYQRKWNEVFSSFLQIYETDYKLKAINADLIMPQTLQQENIVSETSIKIKTIYSPNAQISLLNGYQFVENGTSNLTQVDQPLLLNFVREVIREHSVFSQAEYKTQSKALDIKAGIRLNYIEKFNKFLVEPRLGIDYMVNPEMNVELLGEYKHQNISQIINFQKDFLGIEKRRWRLANEKDVPIIQSKNISLGINFNPKSWLINAEIYYKQISGITTQSQGFINQYIYTKSIGEYNIKGFDLLINKRFSNLSSWLSYSYTDNNYTFPDLNEIHFPNNLEIKHSFTTGMTYSHKNFKTSIGLNWHTGKPTTLPVPGNEIVNNQLHYNPANSSRLGNYFRLDWSATYHFKLKKNINALVGASLWNITNRKNILSQYYGLDNNHNLIEFQQKSLGFTPNLSLRINF